MVGPARQPQREPEQRDRALRAAQKRRAKKAAAVRAPQAQVAESAHKGPGTRLGPRPRALAVVEKERKAAQAPPPKRAAPAAALGPPRERAERDLRKPTSMTIRPLRLENALTSLMAVLRATLTLPVSLDGLWHIRFERRGARLELDSQMLYGSHTPGLAAAYPRLLTAVVNGRCAMDLREQGKPLRVRLKGLSP